MLFFSYPFTSLCNDTLILSHFLVVGNYEFTIAVLLSASQSTSYPIFSERKRSGTIVLPFTSLAGTSILAGLLFILALTLSIENLSFTIPFNLCSHLLEQKSHRYKRAAVFDNRRFIKAENIIVKLHINRIIRQFFTQL